MRYLNTLYITAYQTRVGYRRGSLVVSSPEETHRIPLEGLDAVILFTGQITTDAITECVKRNIRVASLTRAGRIRFIIGGPTSGNVHLRISQYFSSTNESCVLKLCRVFVAAKLQNSARVLSRWSRDNSDSTITNNLARRVLRIKESIERVAIAPTPDHVRGLEGEAARLHFGGIAQVLNKSLLNFEGRRRRPPRDPVNATLSFCYSLVITEITAACDAVGLDPQIGFLHTARSGRPSLALDLAEEMRPLIDRFIIGLIRRWQIDTTDFMNTPGRAVYLTETGRKKILNYWEEHKMVKYYHPVLKRDVGRWALPTVQATLLARYLRGDLPMYPPFLLRG